MKRYSASLVHLHDITGVHFCIALDVYTSIYAGPQSPGYRITSDIKQTEPLLSVKSKQGFIPR
jgi:hypothetical protein